MIKHNSINRDELIRSVKGRKILYAGNQKLKIYGRLNCRSGKRMNIINRVFFAQEQDAIVAGFRPCARCMKVAYAIWKERKKQVDLTETKTQF